MSFTYYDNTEAPGSSQYFDAIKTTLSSGHGVVRVGRYTQEEVQHQMVYDKLPKTL